MRPLLEQQFSNFPLNVQVTPTPVNANAQLPAMVESFLISCPQASANNIYFGDQNVSTVSGIEIVKGTTVLFSILQVRQLYELQYPMLDSSEALTCKPPNYQEIPFIVWNLSNLYLVAPAITAVSIMAFKTPYF